MSSSIKTDFNMYSIRKSLISGRENDWSYSKIMISVSPLERLMLLLIVREDYVSVVHPMLRKARNS